MRLRSEKLEDRRRQIRMAATRVFARKGYHETRIADIANEAGVAYGLVYHYFKNKEEILSSIFEDNWTFFIRAIQEVGKGEGSFEKRLDAAIGLMIESYRIAPEVVSVLVVEIARSPMALDDARMQGFKKGFLALAELLSEGQKAGLVRKSIDPMLSAVCLFGALETILTGMVLKIIPSTSDGLDRVRKQVGDLFLHGFASGSGKTK